MAYLTYNGITLPTLAGSFRETTEHIGDEGRGQAGEYGDNLVARKRTWACTLVAQTKATAVKMRRYLEGEGQAWRFDGTAYSFKGEGPKAGGSFSVASGKVNVGSNSFIEFALANALTRGLTWAPTQGWTLGVRKVLTGGDGGDGSTYVRHIATGSVAVARGAAANPVGVTQYKNGVAGNHSMGNWIDVASDGDVGIYGKTNANGNAAYDYDDLWFLPFAVESSWVAGLDAFLAAAGAHSRLKRVVLAGDALEDAAPGVEAYVRGVGKITKRRAGVPATYPFQLELRIREA